MKRFLVVSAALLLLPQLAVAQGQVVGVNGNASFGDPTNWVTTQFGEGTAQVTANNPRLGFDGRGTGSLELGVTGNGDVNDQFPDWAFWYRYAGGSAANTINTGQSFGQLSQITSLSFDWYRTAIAGWDAEPPVGAQPVNPLDWTYKTPVVRLQLVENNGGNVYQSELIWEGYYNQNSIGPSGTPVGSWVTQDSMQNDNFWYIRHDTNLGAVHGNADCAIGELSFWEGNAASSSIDRLFGNGGCLFGSSVSVIGVAVGVGSAWPLEWRGFADNVRLGFNDTQVLDANFDFLGAPAVVPEPASIALTLLALGALGFSARRRR